jgi:hypothetical protein
MSAVAVSNQRNNFLIFSETLTSNHKDLIDLVRYSLKWSQHFFSRIGDSLPITKSIKILTIAADTFCLNFAISDFNAFLKTEKFSDKMIEVLCDTVTDVCDTISWLSSSNIAFVGIKLMRFQVASSVGLVIGYGKRSISTLGMIMEKNENHLWLTLIKNISYMSLGILGIISASWQINLAASFLFWATSAVLASISLRYQQNSEPNFDPITTKPVTGDSIKPKPVEA